MKKMATLYELSKNPVIYGAAVYEGSKSDSLFKR